MALLRISTNNTISFLSFSSVQICKLLSTLNTTYVQGQSPEPRMREYFYYIDHQGMLFLDDSKMKNFTSCFKEKKFLAFFFKQLRLNDTNRYNDSFPYLSLCGRERNFVRCDDLPFVFTHVVDGGVSSGKLSYAHVETLDVPFEPGRLCMLPETGRVYHPAPERVGGVGLVRSKLAIEFSKSFTFGNGENEPPTHFTWKEEKIELTNDLLDLLRARSFIMPE